MYIKALCCNVQVEDAQAHEAPVQRLADGIAGPFVYTVITVSAATFAFWYGLASHLVLSFFFLHTNLWPCFSAEWNIWELGYKSSDNDHFVIEESNR